MEQSDSQISNEMPPNFIPWGAFAFLLGLAGLCLLLWFSVYYLMVSRA